MPQLDRFIFSSAVFWLIVLFLGFYFLFFNFILPNIYSVLKIRNTTFVTIWNKMNAYANRKGSIVQFYNTFFISFFQLQLVLSKELEKTNANHQLSTFSTIVEQNDFASFLNSYKEVFTSLSVISSIQKLLK
jgi:hypothetical protein